MALPVGIDRRRLGSNQLDRLLRRVEDADHQAVVIRAHAVFQRLDLHDGVGAGADVPGQLGRLHQVVFVLGAAAEKGQDQKGAEGSHRAYVVA
jgi:hypothetical protein